MTALDRFSEPTRAWFTASFPAPTEAQEGAWDAISSGHHTLVVAPTGSGKTLSAFLWSIDSCLSARPNREAGERSGESRNAERRGGSEGGRPPSLNSGTRIVYVSPLKALAVDVERNLRSPLVGIRHAATRLGTELPELRVAVRSGDTPASERRAFARDPADILITTPESLFLMLTSAVRDQLRGVETVIIDEVHAVAGTKRGAHLALTLDRLDALLERPAQRIGLSATVRPVEEVARYLAGGRPVEIVQPPSHKEWDLRVVVPVPDLGSMGETTGDLSGSAAGDPRRASIWPHVEERIVDLITSQQSTLVFANSRRLAERLTARLNEIWLERLELGAPARVPALVMGQAGSSSTARPPVSDTPTPILARAHHGSVSREQRALIEDDLKAGRLPAVVATSSLELGIDMGAIDLVVQVESPPSVASGLQRVGRAGHQVGAVSRGVVFPKFRGDLVQTAVITERMRAVAIEALRLPSNPLDVLSQQIVAMCAMDDWPVDDLEALVRRSASFGGLTRPVLESVLDMLSGRYPSDEFAELRPRIVWDRATGLLTGRRGAQRLAVTSGGTIPDRGLFGVFLAGSEGAGRRVGELDEEMVYESRVGDVITLGTSTWLVEEITHDRVLVTPAPGVPGRLPFWKGDTLGRGTELGAAVGAFVREVGHSPDKARSRLGDAGLDEWASDNLLAYLAEQKTATGHLPDDRTIVVERFRDELGDWRVVVHSPFGAQVHAPWALCVAARMRERYGLDVQAMHGDDGLVFRLPDTDWDGDSEPGGATPDELLELIFLPPDEVHDLVVEQIGGSALFASRFRECAGRALLLPKRRPDRRQALWQQRQRAAALLEVASTYPSFPIVLEAVRECVQDVFDVPGLVDLMRRIDAREIATVQVETPTPSPFAGSLMFGYVAQFLYEGDSPLAEKRAAALSLDPTLLGELLGTSGGLALRDLLDPAALTTTEAELQYLLENRRARDAEDVADLLRVIGPLSQGEVARRVTQPDQVGDWLAALETQRRAIRVRVGEVERWAAIEDAGRLRDALGTSLPVGLPEAFLTTLDDPLGDLVARYARSHATFTLAETAAWLGLGQAVVRDQVRRLVASGRVVEGELRPIGWLPSAEPPPVGDHAGMDFCDARVLRTLRRRSLASLRSEVEPVDQSDYARFLPSWQGVGGSMRGRDGLLRAVEQLSGVPLPASALETLVLPSRVRDYSPAMLDELTSSGEVLWQGHGAIAGADGWISLHLAELAPLTLTAEEEATGDVEDAVVQALVGGGAYFFRPLSDRLGLMDDKALSEALWRLVWAGQLTNDTIAPLRAHLLGGTTTHKRAPSGPRQSRYGGRPGRLRGTLPRPTGPPEGAGRWSLLPARELDVTARAVAASEVLLDRYGVLTRGSVASEGLEGGFSAVYKVLSAAEEAGAVRRGYFVSGLGAAQFGTVGAVDRLRAQSKPEATALVLAACDPANPWGASLAWPAHPGTHQPGRKAGAMVVSVEGALVLYVERGGRTLLSWGDDPAVLGAAASALAGVVHAGHLGKLTVEKIDGGQVLGSDHPLALALSDAGFHLTPRGLRLRR